MASKFRKLREHYQLLVDEAKKGLTPNPDGKSYIEDQVKEALANILLSRADPMDQARRSAQNVIDTLARVPHDDDDDPPPLQLQLPGIAKPFGYDPRRLVRDLQGNVVEEQDATLAFSLADTSRSSSNLARIAEWNARKLAQTGHFQTWTMEQLTIGRDPKELTWGNCVKETGILRGK